MNETRARVERFFERYEAALLARMAEAPRTVWADVTWSFDGRPRERFCYQLIETATGYQVAVLTHR